MCFLPLANLLSPHQKQKLNIFLLINQYMNFSNCWKFSIGAKPVSESFNSPNQAKGWGKGRHLSSYTEDSICYFRPSLPSDTRRDLPRQFERVLFYRFLKFKLDGSSSCKGEKPSSCEEEAFALTLYWHWTWWDPRPMVSGSFQLVLSDQLL